MMKAGQHWIFLRGLSREQEHWDSFVPYFENRMKASVHCIDLPGTGKFFTQTSPSSITGIADHLVAESGAISDQCWILAHSMGALAAMEWMKREPHRFHGAVLINTSARNYSSVFQRLRPRALWDFIRFLLSVKNPRAREEIKYELTCNHPDKLEETVARWMDIQKRHPVSLRTMWNQIWAAAMYSSSKPRYPVLILSSLGDRLVDPLCSETIAKQWRVPLRTHLWAGHDIAHDDPEWIVNQVLSWMDLDSNSST